MRYTLLVLTPPDLGASNRHALEFARALLSAGHELCSVFFYDAGVLTALAGTEAAQDEDDLREGWRELASKYTLPLHACVASAARFGLGQDNASDRLLPGFSICGLGELIDASARAERLLTFAD